MPLSTTLHAWADALRVSGAVASARLGALLAAGHPVLAIETLGVGWTTFGVVLPQGATTGPLQAGSLPTQTDIKARWPDGSIKHAILTVHCSTAGPYPLREVTPSGQAPYAPTWPNVSMQFVTGGHTYTARLPAFDSSDPWLVGPLVTETRVYVTPFEGVIPHPLLQVRYDIRSFSDGTQRIDVSVLNVRDVTAGAAVTYDVTLTVNGQTALAQKGLTHPYLTLWRWTVLGKEAVCVPDLEPFYQAKAIPRYLPTVVDKIPVVSGPKFGPLQFGDMSATMASPGGRPDIGPYPDWIAHYLVHKRPEQFVYMMATANLSGSWRNHITEADGKTLVSVDKIPAYWLDGRAGNNTVPNQGAFGPNAVRQDHQGGPWPGGWSEPLDTAHIPSLNFIPYLLSGDRFHLDQMKFWSNAMILMCNRGANGNTGLLSDNQPRGIGWAIRSLGDLAAYIPDADPMAGYFRSKLTNNLQWLDTVGQSNGGPFGFLFLLGPTGANSLPTDRTYCPWQTNYIGWGLERCRQHGFGPTKVLLPRIAANQLRFFTSDPGWPRIWATYYPTVASTASGSLVYLPTMAEIYQRSSTADPRNIGYAGQYGVDARLMLKVAIDKGLAGAPEALVFLMSQPGMVGDVNARSGWAIA